MFVNSLRALRTRPFLDSDINSVKQNLDGCNVCCSLHAYNDALLLVDDIYQVLEVHQYIVVALTNCIVISCI